MHRFLSFLACFLLIAMSPPAATDFPDLTRDEKMRRGGLPATLAFDEMFSRQGVSPSAPAWSPDSRRFAFTWHEAGWPSRALYLASNKGDDLRLLLSSNDWSVRSFAWLDDTTILTLHDGSLWRLDVDKGTPRRIAEVGAEASGLAISPDGTRASFLVSGDLWLVTLDDGELVQATDVGIPRLSSLAAGRYARAEREIGPGIWSGPTYAWAPDGKTIAMHIVDRRQMRKLPFPNYLSEETNPNLVRRGYPGDSNEIRMVALLDVDTVELRWLDLPEPDANQVIGFSWSPTGALLVDTASDTAVDRRLYVVAPGSAALREVWHGHREERMYTSFASSWHPDGKNIVFLSDRQDRYGLYAIDASPSKDLPQLLTDPDYDVLSAPTVVAANDSIFFSGNGEGPQEQHVYRVGPADEQPVRITRMPGHNTGFPSPDGRHLAVLHNSDVLPPTLFVQRTDGGDATRVTWPTQSGYPESTWVPARYVSFPSRIDDYTLTARIVEPPNLDPDKQYPVLFGPVYSGTARNQWRGVYSLVQQYLVQQGYIVVQVDSRGSTGYGRAFREEFLLGFADEDIDDLASTVAYMESLPYVDPDRIGIWGSSYGGTLSVYSLLMKPGLFQAAVAAASAVDPAFFGTDDVAIVRRPDTHPEIFERKALKYAANLDDHLLLIHGMQDHVVPFKTTAVLAEALIKEGKNFDFAFAPGATHSWAREPHYQRYLFGKLVEFFDRHLKEE